MMIDDGELADRIMVTEWDAGGGTTREIVPAGRAEALAADRRALGGVLAVRIEIPSESGR